MRPVLFFVHLGKTLFNTLNKFLYENYISYTVFKKSQYHKQILKHGMYTY